MWTRSVEFRFKKEILTSEQMIYLHDFALNLENARDENYLNHCFNIEIKKQIVKINIWWFSLGEILDHLLIKYIKLRKIEMIEPVGIYEQYLFYPEDDTPLV